MDGEAPAATPAAEIEAEILKRALGGAGDFAVAWAVLRIGRELAAAVNQVEQAIDGVEDAINRVADIVA